MGERLLNNVAKMISSFIRFPFFFQCDFVVVLTAVSISRKSSEYIIGGMLDRAPFLASAHVCSLPCIWECPGTQCILTSSVGRVSKVLWISPSDVYILGCIPSERNYDGHPWSLLAFDPQAV